jgi:uncharacterized membrane protein YphA (DoxX/SURF4 family)
LIGSIPAAGWAFRAALASPFLASGLIKLLGWEAALVEFTSLGFRAPRAMLAAVIVTQIFGSLLLLSRRTAWVGAGILAVFTGLATVIAHPFWQFDGGDRVRQLTTFLEHLAIIGGLAAAAVLAGAPPPAARDGRTGSSTSC